MIFHGSFVVRHSVKFWNFEQEAKWKVKSGMMLEQLGILIGVREEGEHQDWSQQTSTIIKNFLQNKISRTI